jgi:hypothetical protein
MTQPTLDLHGQPRPILHRPRLAALACLLLAIAAVFEILKGLIPMLIGPASSRTYAAFLDKLLLQTRLTTICVCASCLLIGLGAVCLYGAHLALHSKISNWPRRLLLLFALLYFAARITVQVRLDMVLSHLPVEADAYSTFTRVFFWPMLLFALAAASAAYAMGLVYALQIAVFLKDKTFRNLSLAILGTALLITVAQTFLTANFFALSHNHGIELPMDGLVDIIWTTLQFFLASSLVVFFFILAHRLRRAAQANA